MFIVCLVHVLGLLPAEQLTAGQEGIDERTLTVGAIAATIVASMKTSR